MPKRSASGRGPRNRSDWNSAWEIVSRLAAAREAALREGDPAAAPIAGSERRRAQRTPVTPPGQVPIDAELARAVAEIEQAAAALRRSEPGLEAWHPGQATKREARRLRPVWILIGGIWLSASLMVAGATGALLYLLG